MTSQYVMKITKALADPTRFRILQTIANARERCCGELARDFPITQATVSQHLKVLTDAGLVEPRRQGQFNYYRCGVTSSTRTNAPWRRRWRGRPP